MDTRQVLLADAFADEPLGGLPVAVLPDGEGLSSARLRRVAGEFGAAGAVTVRDEELTYVASESVEGFVAGAVAGGAALCERGRLDPGTHTMAVEGVPASEFGGESGDDERGPTELEIEIESDRTVAVPLRTLDGDDPTASTADIAGALGIDVAAMEDVGADLPPAHVQAYGGTLLAPVNFLEHLSRADPDRADLAELLADTGSARLCAFSFDTLGNDTDLHARVFDPAVTGCERPASGVAVGACGAHLARHAVFDGDRDAVRAECGHFLDRPGTVETTLEAAPRVRGHALTVLDGTLTLPTEDDDDIIEA